MAGFDPDAYLAQKEAPQGFDPDAYLKEKDTTAQATFDPDSYLRGKDAPLLTEDPAGYALAGLHDKTRREEAYQAYQAKHRQPTTITSAGNAALDFAKGAIPMKREDGTWHWPLGGAAVSMAKGGYDTLKNISKAGGLDTPTGAIFGPLAGAVKSAFDEDPERLKAGRQLGAGAELGVIEAGHQLVSAGRNISGLASAATGGHVGTMEKDISDEEMRRRFKEEIAYRYLTQGMGQGHYAEELAGHPTAMITPEELAAKGAPINPEEIGGIASTTSPMNLAEIGALTNPITGKVMAPLLKGVAGVGEKAAGAIATGAENLAKSKLAHAVTVPALIADVALTGGAHTAAAATAAGAGAATWAGAKLAQGALGAAREAGEEMLGEAPSIGQGFFRKTIKEGIKGATGAVPVAGVFSLGGDNAESAGDTFWSVLGLGAAGGAISGAKNARLIDAQAQFARMAKSGSTVNYGDATDQAHRSIVSQLSPEAASIINFWRGSFDGATTPDGKPIRVQAVDDATFQKMTGQSSRGAYFTDGRLIVNAGHFENGTFIPQTAAQLAEVFAHEGKHSIDEATKAAQPELYKSVFDSLKKRFTDADGGKATPDFLQWIQGQMQLHLNNLAEAGATPAEIDAKMSRLGDLGYWLNEASADIGQGLITGAPMGTFQLSQPMIAKVWDAVKDAAASKGVTLPSKGDATTGALDLPSAQEAAREIRRQLYAQGKETNARQSAKESKGKTIGDRISELTPIAARPITAATSMEERKETRDAQREIAELQKDIGAAAPIPSSGPAPTAPSAPIAPRTAAPARNAMQMRVAAALRLNGIPAAEAHQWAAAAQGATVEEMVLDALKKRAGQKFQSPTQSAVLPPAANVPEPQNAAPTESPRPDDLPPEPTRTATIPERPVDAPEPVTLSPADVDRVAAEAESDAVEAAKAHPDYPVWKLAKKSKFTEQEQRDRLASRQRNFIFEKVKNSGLDAVAAAHAEGLPANYQGVRQRTDALGNTTISGTFNPERPFDAFLLKLADISKPATEILLNLQSKIGQTVTLNYGHAPETEGKVTAESRKAAQKASSAQARASGEADTQAEDKNYIPLEFRFNKGSDTPSITVIGASPEKLLNNFNLAGQAVTELGGEVPYRDIHDPHLVADMKGVARNHANGWKGDGSAKIDSFPDVQVPGADEGFKPYPIPQDRFEFLNLILGDESAKTGKKGASPEQKLKQGLAAKNQIPMTDAGEVNILRESINRAKGEVLGKDGQPTTWSKATIENPLSEALRVDLINEIKPEFSNKDASIRPHGYGGDIGRFFAEGSPNRTFTSAGFMPSEHRIPGLDDNPTERISSSAIRLGNGKIVKGVTHADASQMARDEGVIEGPADLSTLSPSAYGDLIHRAGIEDGFITSDGRFVDREEGYKIAKAQAQLKPINSSDAYGELDAASLTESPDQRISIPGLDREKSFYELMDETRAKEKADDEAITKARMEGTEKYTPAVRTPSGQVLKSQSAREGHGELSALFPEQKVEHGFVNSQTGKFMNVMEVARENTNPMSNADVSKGPGLQYLPAYHGTPHKVDKFSVDKISTGEGNQVFGWGLYFAQNKDVASFYKNTRNLYQIDGKQYEPEGFGSPGDIAAYVLKKHNGNKLKALKSLRDDWPTDWGDEAIDIVKNAKNFGQSKGSIYTVDIDAKPHELLDWDKPISEQPAQVQKALKSLGATGNETGVEFHSHLIEKLSGVDGMSGAPLENDAHKKVSDALLKTGIVGIQFLDQRSRNKGDGTRNFVVFDDSRIKITHENGEPVTPAERREAIGKPNARDAARKRIENGPQFMPTETMRDDMTTQAGWLEQEAISRGYKSTDELVAKEPGEFRKLSARWRLLHPRDESGFLSQNTAARSINSVLYGDKKSDSLRPVAGTREAFRDAAQIIGGDGEAGRPPQEQADALRQYAQENGLAFSQLPRRFVPGSERDKGGMEHHVWADPKSGRWIKATSGNGAGMGMQPRLTEDGWEMKRGTVKEYLESRDLWNQVFGDDIRLHGVHDDGHSISVVTSQPDITGSPMTAHEISKAMESAGFDTMGDSVYYRRQDNVAVFDLHESNVVNADGSMIPFDGVAIHPSEELLDVLKFEKATGKSKMPIDETAPKKNFMEAARQRLEMAR